MNLYESKNNDEILFEYLKAEKSNSIKTIIYHFIEFIKSKGDEIVIEALNQASDKSVA